jgi:antirestriction protein ArdC
MGRRGGQSAARNTEECRHRTMLFGDQHTNPLGCRRRTRYPVQSWLTYRQALELGGNVRKGQHGTTAVYANRFTPDDEKRRAQETDEEARSISFLKRFTVFNVAQCEGLPDGFMIAARPSEPSLIEPKVKALIDAMGIDFRIGGTRAFYSPPPEDYVQVPPPQAYFDPINWHRTALHEIGHLSGAPHRLGRDLSGSFGSRKYAFEEIVALSGQSG